MSVYLSRFESVAPPYMVDQSSALDWLAKAHARNAPEVPFERFAKLLHRYGCSPDQIEKRGSFLKDFAHQDWESMQLFARPACLDQRTDFFKEALLAPVERLYAEGDPDFRTWIHVTCTGYASPSVVQTLASARGWGAKVECLHAYHMGCYAAFPALRMAKGNLDAEVLHTELCTLHLDPSNHDPEQLVIQSLFADGVIRYRVSEEVPGSGFEVLDLKEVIAPSSLRQMQWEVSARGFRMTLAREVPGFVQEGVRALSTQWPKSETFYAIHPGGPRIIDAVKTALDLSEEQVYFSRQVLREHGNMSSATLPHVWESMLHRIPRGAHVVSMAFGPGLTLSTGIMRKI